MGTTRRGGEAARGRSRETKLMAGLFYAFARRPGMNGRFGYEIWLPSVLTVALLFIVVFVTAWLVSNTWADLIGLFYLMVSPIIHGFLKSLMRERPGGRKTSRDRPDAGNAGQ